MDTLAPTAWSKCQYRPYADQYAADLGLSVDQLFDSCTNVRAGAHILTVEYQRAAALDGEGQTALRRPLSEYNSGSPIVGFDNGYVSIVADGEF